MSTTLRAFILSIFVAVSLSASTASAQGLRPVDTWLSPLPTAGERKAADIASWATDVTVIALDVRATWKAHCEDTWDACEAALFKTGLRYGTVYGATFLLKKAFARTRPCAPACGSDNPDFSFPSGHTASAFAAVGGPSIYVAVPLAVTTGGLRIAAGKHWLTDTLFGAGIGLAASRIR